MPAALDFEPFIAELRLLVKTTWPEVSAVYDLERVERQEWDGLELPYAVIRTSDWPEAPVRPMARMVHEGQVTVTYVDTWAGNVDGLRAKMSAIENAVLNTLFAHATLMKVANNGWSDAVYPNLELTRRKSPQRAGELAIVVDLFA